MKALNNLLDHYLQDTEDPSRNYALANEYALLGQTASEVLYLMRTAERTDVKEIQYECLLRIGNCFSKQGNRQNSVQGAYKRAITILPERPEAYFLLSRHYEYEKKYMDSYLIASLGLELARKDFLPLAAEVGYPGWYGLEFEKAVSAWWWGKPMESRRLFREIGDKYYDMMDNVHREAVERNIRSLGVSSNHGHKRYDLGQYNRLRCQFPGSENIRNNYSQSYQDMFVLTALNGKRDGTFLEIGSADPFHGNNTALLEEFGWGGYGIEMDADHCKNYNESRRSKCKQLDAYKLKPHIWEQYCDEIAREDGVIDYLQLDCDPSHITYGIMLNLPFDKYRFAVITYEHDHYADMTKSFRNLSREFLWSKGYKLFVADVSPDGNSSYEDWWVHPDLVINHDIKSDHEGVIDAEAYMLKSINNR